LGFANVKVVRRDDFCPGTDSELKFCNFVELNTNNNCVMLQAAPKNVHIYLESNPNPNSLKFVVNDMLVPEGLSFDFPDADSASVSPLAQELFAHPFVDRVFFASNFVTVTKKGDVEWLEIQQTLKDHIRKFLEEGKMIIDVKDEDELPATEEETETVKKIKTILDDYIRPAVEQDGGAITYHSFRDGVVKVKLQGSCSGCPSSTVTLKAGIENLFTRMMPGEVQSVEAL
jgi:NFU1 iron-sulfur cluster scaffold homolog, mitochondrial